jgi:hypothetical protein
LIHLLSFCVPISGMLLLDAFRAFDYDKDGVLSLEEFYGGMTWLKIDLDPSEVKELFLRIDSTERGFITFKDFTRALGDPIRKIKKRSRHNVLRSDDSDSEDDEVDVKEEKDIPENEKEEEGAGEGEGDVKWEGILPRSLKPQESKIQSRDILESRISRVLAAAPTLRIDVVNVPHLSQIWNSDATGARSSSTIWASNLPAASNNRVHICVGHYVSEGIGSHSDGILRKYITVTDVTNWRLFKSLNLDEEILGMLLPHPTSYQEVWRQRRGDRPLYIWKPIPPTGDYVSLGMLATPSEDPPDASECRCVPRIWLVPSKTKPRRVWTDAGSGGRAGSFWIMENLGLLQVTPTHLPPNPRDFFEFDHFPLVVTHRLNTLNMKWGEIDKSFHSSAVSSSMASSSSSERKQNEEVQSLDEEEKEFLCQQSLILSLDAPSPSSSPSTSAGSSSLSLPTERCVGSVCDLISLESLSDSTWELVKRNAEARK